MKIISYRIHLLEPVLVTSLDGDPNSATAFDYLPGSVLRGAIIGRYMRERNLTPAFFDAADPEMHRLFFDATTRYLNGYLVAKNQRTLPTPQSWQWKKGHESEIFDFAIRSQTGSEDGNGNLIQWQGVKRPFCLVQDDENECRARLLKPKRLIVEHTARDRKYGRARSESGALYRYESLQAGQTFEAIILCDSDANAATLLPLLKDESVLGGSRSGGYGRVSFLEQKEENSNWSEVARTLQTTYNGTFIVTLLSDVLLRDVNGQFTVDSENFTASLSAALGNITLSLQKDNTFFRGTTIGGFNRKWGLPLPQVQAIKMGSVFVYDAPSVDATVLQRNLEEFERQGMGERRAEGFGRVAFNWHTEEYLKVDPSEDARPPTKAISDPNSVTLAKKIVGRMLRKKLDAALAERANSLGKNIKGVEKSQLSRLRLIIHDALRKEQNAGREELNLYLNRLGARKATRKQFTKDRVADYSTLEWLHQRVNDAHSVDLGGFENPAIGNNIAAEITSTMIYEYNLRLIDGVLARAAKQKRKEN